MNSRLILSILLFAAGIFLFRRTYASLTRRLLFSLVVFLSWIYFLFYIISDYFTNEGINTAVIYHIRAGLGGAGFSEYSYLIISSIVALVIGIAISFWASSRNSRRSYAHNIYSYAGTLIILISMLSNPASIDLYNIFFGVPKIQRETDEFSHYYKQPSIKKTGSPRNLVIVYAESLERTYFNEDIFPGLIKNLRALEARSTSFTNIRQVDGTEWTIGGIVASQCGLPLFAPSHGNSMAGMDKFLSSAVCMGDLLREEGYHMAYYGGGDLEFAGKIGFFSTHGFNEIMGREELLPMLDNQNYTTGWGLFDDSLLSIAYKRFLELSESGQRFALVLLTLDTHHPYGHPSFTCRNIKYRDGSNKILNAVACSDFLIGGFVDAIMRSAYGTNTVIVVASDHLAMNNSASSLLDKGERKNLLMIIDPNGAGVKLVDKPGSMLDFGPTVLPFMGYNGSLGLGRDLRDRNLKRSEISHIQNTLNTWRNSVIRFWDFPNIQNSISVDMTRKILSLDGRTFLVPALVELTPDLNTIIKFDFWTPEEDLTLIERVLALDNDTPFLLVDKCNNTYQLADTIHRKGFCLVAGKGSGRRNVFPLLHHSDKLLYTLTTEDIRFFTCLNSPKDFKTHRIAHAGGGIGTSTYTNSLDALDHNIKKGFRYFELDFNFTSDGKLACIHDWHQSFKRFFGFEAETRPTLDQFKQMVKDNSKFDMCSLDTLLPWLEQNPGAYIVTDVKDNNLKALEMLKQNIPNFNRRIIPQIYTPNNYEIVKEMGYEQVIWTLYRFSGSNNDVLKWVDTFKGPFAITMPTDRALSSLPVELAERRIPTYVHTINGKQQADAFMNVYGVTELYTDFLEPDINKTCTQTD